MVFSEYRHSAYDHLDAKKMMGQRHGTQAGDPKKGGQAMYQLAVLEDPPLRAVIGTDAYKVRTPLINSSRSPIADVLQAIMTKIQQYSENYPKYEKISNSTDVEGYQAPS